MSIQYYYSAYNLNIQSDMLIPCLPPAKMMAEAALAVTIAYGTVAREGLQNPIHSGFAYQASKTEFWLNIPTVARFLVFDGNHIIIDPADGVDEDSIHAFLLSTCMEVLLRQRQLCVMPGYAFKLGEYGIAFLGGSGPGQSILQGLFYKRNYSFLASNFVALNPLGNILPGVPQIELWSQIISSLKLDEVAVKTVRPNIKKRVIPLEHHYYPRPQPLHFIYTPKMHQNSDVIFTTINEEERLSYLSQWAKLNHLPIHLWYEDDHCVPHADALNHVELICIHLPAKGLKLQQIADSVENDLTERGHYHAQH